MGLNKFGGSPADVTTDSAGNVVGGIVLQVYTAEVGGQRITELYDPAGAPLPGTVTSATEGEELGRFAFQASDQYQVVYLDAGYGTRWSVPARAAFSAAAIALVQSAAALSAAQDAQDAAELASTKADLASAEVDAKLGFDFTKISPRFVTSLRVDPATVVQSFARDALTGQYYASQALGSIGGTTSLVVSRCSPDGAVLDTCTFEGGGHGSTTAIERDGANVWLWFRWTYDSSGGTYTNRMVRAKYQPGVVVKRNDPAVLEVMDVSGDLLASFDIDQAADRLSVRINITGTTERYALYRLSDYKAGRNTPLAQLGPYTWTGTEDGPYQGHCSLDGFLYLVQGNRDTGTACTITRLDWDTGETAVVNIDNAGRRGDAWPGGRNEPEGVCVWRGANGTPSLLFGKAVGDFGYRQALVYAFSPPAGDDPAGETIRSAITDYQAGKIGVPGGNGEVSTRAVVFQQEFNRVPVVVVSADSTSPGTVVQEVTYGGVTTKGFNVYTLRQGGAVTGVSWHAYAGPGINPTVA